MKYPFTPWCAHNFLSCARSCATIRHPGGVRGVVLKSKLPHSLLWADFAGSIQDGRNMLSINTATGSTLSHLFFRKVGLHPYSTNVK